VVRLCGGPHEVAKAIACFLSAIPFLFLADLCVDDGLPGLGTEGLEEILTGVGIT